MTEKQLKALQVVLELAEVGIKVQSGLDDLITEEFHLPKTFPIPSEEGEASINLMNNYLNLKTIPNKSQNHLKQSIPVQNNNLQYNRE
jgi:hypothetical protein